MAYSVGVQPKRLYSYLESVVRKFWLLSFIITLIGCGGGGEVGSPPTTPKRGHKVSDYRYKVMLETTPSVNPGFNVSMTLPNSFDPEVYVAGQAATQDLVVMQILPSTKAGDFSGLPAALSAAAKYPNINAVYLYDEVFWVDNQIQIGMYGSELLNAASIAKAAGYYTTVSILPEVILHTNFFFSPEELNRIDVIGIDIYPSLGIDWSYGEQSTFSNNLYTNTLYLSITKLRNLGFTGSIWYIYQAFGVATDTDLEAKLLKQRETIAFAPQLGVTGLVAFGYKPYSGLDLPLYPGQGTNIDHLVGGTNF